MKKILILLLLTGCETSPLYSLAFEDGGFTDAPTPAFITRPTLEVIDAGAADTGGLCDAMFADCLRSIEENGFDSLADQVAKCELVRDRCYGE